MKKLYFITGILSAVTFASFANLPSTGSTLGSMAPQSDVSEIQAKRHADLSFDSDLKRLSAIQGRYHENLPRRKLEKRSVKTAQKTTHTAKRTKL